jgi:hypothetical protein
VVRRVAASHGGRIALRLRPHGSAAEIELPIPPGAAGRSG